MKTKIIQLTMVGLIVLGALIIGSMVVDFPPQLTKSFGVNAVYAQNDNDQGDQGQDNDYQNGNPVPEPSTLILLGTGLAAGGGIYSIIRYRRRNKKK